eukprot:m51a1_g6193 hypothetical protein (314) ;mRNA; f:85901-87480
MSRVPAELLEKWKFITGRPYSGQAKWMLNGFWDKLEPEAENVWQWVQSFVRFDESKRADGSDLDEFWSHKFLESLGQTMTVIEMREKFRAIDADFNKRMSLVEWIMYRYKFAIPDVINAPQGENKEELAKAQAMVESAQRAVDDMNRKLETSRAAEVASKKAGEAAWYAEQEARAALAEQQKQEKAFEDRKAALEATKNDSSAGLVKRNKASNELEQLLSEDPLPLRKAKTTSAAAVKKNEKARADAEAAKAKAAQDIQNTEAAIVEATAKLQEAVEYLEKVKRIGGVANGDIWWMQREIAEKKKYLPANKAK